MFSIFKKKNRKPTVDLSALVTDMHSHLLPGIDDGANETADSLTLIRGLQELGYRKLITTPHVMGDIYKNNRQTIGSAYDTLQAAMQADALKADIRPAAEYFLDDHFDRLLADNVPLMTLHEKYVLVEFSFVNPPLDFQEKIFRLQIKGYQPVLAHPERYLYFKPNKANFDALKTAGCLFQVNLLSLAGYYGKPVQELAHYLIKMQYVDLLGTDCHHVRHLSVLQSSGHIMTPVNELLDSGRLKNPAF